MEKKQKIILISVIILCIVIVSIAIGILLFHLKEVEKTKSKKKIIKPPRQHYAEKVALPSIKVFDADELGNTPLHIACKYNHESITIYCINRIVIESKEPSTENILSEYLNKQNSLGETPLHLAIKNPSKDALEVILRNRAINVNIQNNQGETPLHLAIRACDKIIIDKLMNKHADPKIKDKNGDDAYSLAKKMRLKIKFTINHNQIEINRSKESQAIKDSQSKTKWFSC